MIESRKSRRKNEKRVDDQAAVVRSLPMPESRRTFCVSLGCSVLGGLLLWVAFPPLNWWPIAWLAPLPWLYLVLRPTPMTRWAYVGIWLGSFVHWLLMLQGISLAHLLLIGGWVALAAYLAVYVPLFVGLCRVGQRLRIPIVIGAPVIWVGLELARGYIITGFSAGLLSHSQTDWLALVQTADVFGAYGVSFVMMLAAAAVARALVPAGRTFWPLIPAAIVMVLTLAYGSFRLAETPPSPGTPPLHVALIQGSRDVHIDMDFEQSLERMQHYSELTKQAREQNARLDLVIWPESMFALPHILLSPGTVVPSDQEEAIGQFRQEFPKALRQASELLNPPANSSDGNPTLFYFCTTTFDYGSSRRLAYNSAILADEHGEIISRYDKTHAVMFGEYVPFAGWFPVIYDFIPVEGMTEGDQPIAAQVKGLSFSPSICFESTVPHLIRSQVLTLEKQGTPPDVLVNLTNDGWFYGSSILDLHLKCSTFRAIENRRPVLIAANTGISAHIDGSGRVLVHGPKRQPQVLIAAVTPDGRRPLYHTLGDWPAISCAAACMSLLVTGLMLRRKKSVSITRVSP